MGRKPINLVLVLPFLVILNTHVNGQKIKLEIDSTNSIPYKYVVSNTRNSIKIFHSNLEKAQSINYKYGEAVSLQKLGLAYGLNGKYEKQTKVYLKALKIYYQLDSLRNFAFLTGEFGYNLKRANIKKAVKYINNGISIAEDKNFKSILATLYDHYGVIKEMTNDLDSALYYYQKALQIKEIQSDSNGIPFSLNNIAGIYAMKKNYKKSFSYLTKSDNYRKHEKGNFGKAENLMFYGETYLQMGNIDSAISKYKQCLELSKKLGYSYIFEYAHKQLTKCYEQKGNYKKAFFSFKKFITKKDSVLDKETKLKLAELELDYETEKKNKELTKYRFKLKEERDHIIFAAIISIIILIISIGIYRFQKYKHKQIKTELELKNKLTKVEFENKISDEKLRISRELHDNIGSNLTFMISSIDNLTYSGKDKKYISTLTKLSDFGRTTLNELRQTIWAMKNDESNLKQLVLKLTELKKQILTNIEIHITNNTNSEITLSSTQTLNLFRVVQEAIQNTIKYAEANIIEVVFKDTDNGFELTIKDNGKGFDISNVQMGNGISNMKFRCEEAGAVFSLSSNKNGTKITCNSGIK